MNKFDTIIAWLKSAICKPLSHRSVFSSHSAVACSKSSTSLSARLAMGLLSLSALFAQPLAAATIDVVVLDRQGKPVADVIVMAESKTDQPLVLADGEKTDFEMDQKDLMFEPYVLVVPVGASVSFLNSDPTAHHVYSFSKTKRFTLPLHKSRAPDPVLFDTPGVVTLGCNIHDHMVGYIVIAESHLHTRTNAQGFAKLTVDENTDDIRIRIWSPRIKDKAGLLVRDAADTEPVRFTLEKKLKPVYRPQPIETSEWDY